VISWSGSVTPGFKFWIAASFHFVILPWKMSAITCPVNFSPEDTPGMLYATVTAPIVSGMCNAFVMFAASAAVKGASEAPKSTVREFNAEIPPPLPIDW
jgi:hypothetical protein